MEQPKVVQVARFLIMLTTGFKVPGPLAGAGRDSPRTSLGLKARRLFLKSSACLLLSELVLKEIGRSLGRLN